MIGTVIGTVIGIVLIILTGIITALRKEKELRAVIKQLEIDAAALPPDAPLAEVEALAARIKKLGQEIDNWERSIIDVRTPWTRWPAQ